MSDGFADFPTSNHLPALRKQNCFTHGRALVITRALAICIPPRRSSILNTTASFRGRLTSSLNYQAPVVILRTRSQLSLSIARFQSWRPILVESLREFSICEYRSIPAQDEKLFGRWRRSFSRKGTPAHTIPRSWILVRLSAPRALRNATSVPCRNFAAQKIPWFFRSRNRAHAKKF